MSLCFNKKDSPCWPSQSEPYLKLLDCGRKIQNDVHIDTYRKPELISRRWINITVFHTRFLSPTDEKCAESSTYWQFFYYRPPGKFRFTHLGEIVKMLSGRGPTGLQSRLWNRSRLENRSHVVPKNGVSRWRRPNSDIYSQNYHFGLVYDVIYQFLGMQAKNHKFVCFANNVIRPWP